MRNSYISRFLNTALLGVFVLASLALAPAALRAQDHVTVRTYHDKQNNDDHQWNSNENKAYRIYNKQNHRRGAEFSTLNETDQQGYWNWRHEHSDALLKINIK